MSNLKKEDVKVSAKQAPDIEIGVDVLVDDRSRIASEHHKANPEFRYSWQSSTDAQAGRLGRHLEVVKGVEHGNDVLCRMPIEVYKKRRGIEAERSFQMTAKQRGVNPDEVYKTGNLRQMARRKGKKE